MDEKQLNELIAQKIKQWQESQQGQKDGHEYESTFNAMMQNIGRDVLQQSVGEVPADKNLKKNS